MSEDGGIENAGEVLEGFDTLPNDEVTAGELNVYEDDFPGTAGLEESDAFAGFRAPNGLVERLELEPKTEPEKDFESDVESVFEVDFVPKSPRGDAADAEGLVVSFLDDSSNSFCICDRCVLYDSKALVKSVNGSLSTVLLIKFESDTLSPRRSV